MVRERAVNGDRLVGREINVFRDLTGEEMEVAV